MAESTRVLAEWVAQQRRESINYKLRRIDLRRREIRTELEELDRKERELQEQRVDDLILKL
jgi:hypothetical protein